MSNFTDKQQIFPYPGSFLHGVSPKSWLACWNLSLRGWLASPDYLAMIDAGLNQSHQSLRNVPISGLESEIFPNGVLTPRSASYVAPATIVRQGGRIGYGTTDTDWLNDEQQQEIVRRSDLELEFEKRRRVIAPEKASRLCCIWVADNNKDGKENIKRMLPDSHFLKVKLSKCMRVTKADTRWFDKYTKDPDPVYIDNYWQGLPYLSKSTAWEYLVEGLVEFIDPSEIDELCASSLFLNTWNPQLQAPPWVVEKAQKVL